MGLLDGTFASLGNNGGLLGDGGGNKLAQALLARNSAYALPPSVMTGSYQTKLNPLQELAFQSWVKKNGIPFDPSPAADYDMRGFYRAMLYGDPEAKTTMNANDGMPHFIDRFKTPYHESFSAESQWAKPGAPTWNELDQLVLPSGKVVFDERKKFGK
jgi:hypothetical protein